MTSRDMVIMVIAGVAAIPIWMAMDRTPPYIRESGMVSLAMSDTLCGSMSLQSTDAATTAEIFPGSCVTVDWKIKTLRNCPPDVTDNIHPRITDATGVRFTLAPTRGKFGTPVQDILDPNIYRFFRLPVAMSSGIAIYESDVTYACNPLHYIWPVHVIEPKISFTVQPKPADPT